MAKMKIFEIARSIQAKNKEIKSGDLVKLLNDNGFDVKGYNSNIEDKEIAFLLQTFNDPEKVKKFITTVIVYRNTITFVFYNGAEIKMDYSNGQPGNKPGWNGKEAK